MKQTIIKEISVRLLVLNFVTTEQKKILKYGKEKIHLCLWVEL